MENLNSEQISKWRARIGNLCEDRNKDGKQHFSEEEAMKLCDMAGQIAIHMEILREIVHSSDCICRFCAPDSPVNKGKEYLSR